MRIALCSSFVPFIDGGARNIVEWLELELQKVGHKTERIYLPQVDVPELLFPQMMAYRWIDLAAADRVICFRPPAHVIPHPHKILWFIHHIRLFYDLWDSPYRTFPDDFLHRSHQRALHAADTAALQEARSVFTNSAVVSDRLRTYNKIDSEVLYPPVLNPMRFVCEAANDEIVYISRVEHHKRQHLLIDALAHTTTPVKVRICGASSNESYLRELHSKIQGEDLGKRVFLDTRWISEAEKIALLSNCLAAAYLPLDEDSYGYPSLEASHSSKPILTTTDSGGVLELVLNGVNGFVVEPDPRAIADAMDRLYLNRVATEKMGRNAAARIAQLNISWPHVLERILS